MPHYWLNANQFMSAVYHYILSTLCPVMSFHLYYLLVSLIYNFYNTLELKLNGIIGPQ